LMRGVRPCVLLVPEFTEVEWTIRPLLEEWATVRSFDPPGIGDEPRASNPSREGIVRRGLEEFDRFEGEQTFVIADGWGIATAARIAEARPNALAGLVLGHARLSNRHQGEDAPIRPEVYAAMTQLIETDAPSFVRFGIAQVTRGSVDEDLAERMLERIPTDYMADGWATLTADEAFGDLLASLDVPVLLAKHEACLMSSDEGFDAAVARLPAAETIAVLDPPASSAEFAAAVREFCLRIARDLDTGRTE
jgi:hypothetical protein